MNRGSAMLSMLELGFALSAEREPQRMAATFCRAARGVIGARIAGLAWHDADGPACTFWVYAGPGGVVTPDHAIIRWHGVLARASQSGVPLGASLAGDEDAGFPEGHPAAAQLLVVRVALSRGRVGTLYFADRDDGAPFAAADTEHAARLAALLANAQGSLELREELRRSAWETHRELLERRDVEADLRETETRFRQLAENIRTIFFLISPGESKVVYISPAYEEIWGRSCRSLYDAPGSWLEAVHPEDSDVVERMRAARDAGQRYEFEFRILRSDGDVRWVRVTGFPIFDATGAFHRVAGIVDDITQRRKQSLQIARLSRVRAVTSGIGSAMLRQEGRDELLYEACRVAVADGVYRLAWVSVFDPDTQEPKLLAHFGGQPGEMERLERLAETTVAPADRVSARVMRARRPIIINDLREESSLVALGAELARCGYRSGAAFPLFVDDRVDAVLVLLAAQPGLVNAEEAAVLERMTTDLSFALTHIETSRRLDHLAYFDALTGLPNKALLADRVARMIAGLDPAIAHVEIACLDLERFAELNDALGHAACDALLRRVGERLAQAVPEAWTVARISSDTFAVAAVLRSDAVAAVEVRETLTNALRAPFAVGERSVPLAAQLGIAVHPADGGDFATLYHGAATALNQAKTSGARYACYSSELTGRIAERLKLEHDLRLALERNELVVHYQPRADLVSGELVGAEALVRWVHPVDGLVMPGRFIALAEECGLIVPIGQWMIETVAAQQARWAGMGIDLVPIAVNLSPLQFHQADVIAVIGAALKAHALDPRALDFEITESAVMSDPEQTVATLKRLRALGCGLSLDDFGTGYSSLSQLKRFPFNAVKIDRSFVVDITHNAEDAAIATAILAMGHRLGLKVVAEGVESTAQLAFLRDRGCDEIQGHLFAAAMDGSIFEGWLRERRRLELPPRPDAAEQVLLIVDDEPGIRSALTRVLRRDGYRILGVGSGKEALELLAVNRVQVIVADQRMPEMSGTAFLSIVTQLYPDTVRIILSGYTDLEVVTDSVNRGAVFKFLTKPWEDDLLRDQVRDAFRRYRPSVGE